MNQILDAYLWACNCELDALKPGNVHREADGHGMTVVDFEVSASVSAPALSRPGARVGARIFEAVRATKAKVGQNTNLGIILLCAPIAAAAERNETIAETLNSLNLEDAQDCFSAIALANPGGLGTPASHDVRAPATTHLSIAMQAAADRDLIARQYANNFVDVFEVGLPRWRDAVEAGATAPQAASDVYLTFLTRWPDTHIVRKFGQKAAVAVLGEARERMANMAPHGSQRRALLRKWDLDLKAQGLNPGACADLTVATLFTARLLDTISNGLRLFHKSD